MAVRGGKGQRCAELIAAQEVGIPAIGQAHGRMPFHVCEQPPLPPVVELLQAQRVKPAEGLDHAPVHALCCAQAVGIVSVVDAATTIPIGRQVDGKQQAARLVAVVRFGLALRGRLDLQVAEASRVVAVLGAPGLAQAVVPQEV